MSRPKKTTAFLPNINININTSIRPSRAEVLGKKIRIRTDSTHTDILIRLPSKNNQCKTKKTLTVARFRQQTGKPMGGVIRIMQPIRLIHRTSTSRTSSRNNRLMDSLLTGSRHIICTVSRICPKASN